MLEWDEAFESSKELQRAWKIVTHYYSRISKLSKRSAMDMYLIYRRYKHRPSLIPTEKDFRLLVGNKYSQKVIESTLCEPLFKKGEVVTIHRRFDHKTNVYPRYLKMMKIDPNKGFREERALVLKADFMPVEKATKRGKVYLVYLFNHESPYAIEERYIKRYRN